MWKTPKVNSPIRLLTSIGRSNSSKTPTKANAGPRRLSTTHGSINRCDETLVGLEQACLSTPKMPRLLVNDSPLNMTLNKTLLQKTTDSLWKTCNESMTDMSFTFSPNDKLSNTLDAVDLVLAQYAAKTPTMSDSRRKLIIEYAEKIIEEEAALKEKQSVSSTKKSPVHSMKDKTMNALESRQLNEEENYRAYSKTPTRLELDQIERDLISDGCIEETSYKAALRSQLIEELRLKNVKPTKAVKRTISVDQI